MWITKQKMNAIEGKTKIGKTKIEIKKTQYIFIK
jgi:hypothetical protein